jgi:RHS repeat-associated protein
VTAKRVAALTYTWDAVDRMIRGKTATGREDFYFYSTPAGQGETTKIALDASCANPMSETTTYRDGRTAAITGVSVVPAYFSYDAASTPSIWREISVKSYDPAFSPAQGVEVSETDGLGRSVRITRPRSADAAGALLPATSEDRDYNNEGLISRRSIPGPNGGGGRIYDHYSYAWSTTAPYTRTVTSHRSDHADPALGTITDRRVVQSFLENSSGLWWDTRRTKIGASGVEETAKEERVAAGPMNLTNGYYRAKTTSTGTTEEVITSRHVSGNWHETKRSRNGFLFSGSITRNGLAVFSRFNGTLSKAVAWSPLRDLLMEPRSDSTAWVTLTRQPSTGLVTNRTGPGVSENLAYYPLAGDPVASLHRTGRLWKRTPTLATKGPEFYDYNARAQVTAQWGSGGYPQVNGYDTLGRQTTLTTFRSAIGQSVSPDTNPNTWSPVTTAAHAATTTWTYPPFLNLILAKRYQGTVAPANDITYTYKPNGQLATRVWKRGITTTYGYLANGNLSTTTYNDGTPAVTFSWDAAGRNNGRIDAGGTWTLSYLADGRLKQETTGATGRNVDWTFNALGQRQSLASQFSSSVAGMTNFYGYDSYGMLTDFSGAVSAGQVDTSWNDYSGVNLKPNAKYSYLNWEQKLMEYSSFNSLGQLTSKIVETYGEWYSVPVEDEFGNILYEDWYQETAAVESTSYTRNALGQLTLRNNDLEAQRWNYEYDSRSQVSKANKKFTYAPLQVVAGTQAQYTYDQIGNRVEWKEGGTGTLDAGLRTHTYGTGTAGGSANALNQYGTIAFTAQTFDVTGTRAVSTIPMAVTAGSNAPVTPTYQQNTTSGLYFRADMPHTSGVNNRYTPVIVKANNVTIDSWLQYVPPTPEPLLHDLDGNLTADALWLYTWDAENRLVAMASSPSVPDGLKKQLAFTYDSQHRRIRKQVWQAQPTVPFAWILIQDRRFHYQGWNLIAEANPDYSFIKTYLWGLDLSGTFTGAGGTGGLLALTIARGPAAGTHLVTTDGQGNVTQLVSATTSQPTAAYSYDSFGQLLSATGPAAAFNPIRFSTRYEDPETQLLYYSYRYLDPADGRWLNRDPLGEAGGVNLYGFVGNDGAGRVDKLGMATAIFQLFPPDGGRQTGTTADTPEGFYQAAEENALQDLAAEINTALDAFAVRLRSPDREGEGEPQSQMQKLLGTDAQIGLCGYDFDSNNDITLLVRAKKLNRVRQILYQYAGLVSPDSWIQDILVANEMANLERLSDPTHRISEVFAGQGPGEIPGKVGLVAATGAAWDNELVQIMLDVSTGGLTELRVLGRIGSRPGSVERLAANSGGRANTLVHNGMEVRAVRDLSHVDDSTLGAMAEKGFAARTINGDKIVLHHHQQNPAGFIVEMPAKNHNIWNTNQHPFGNPPGTGLTPQQRSAFDAWRVDYWKSRAQTEIQRRAGQ